jgi:carbamoyl-phosphate synthase large subunit
MARAATKLALGARLSDMDLQSRDVPHFGVKEAVFPFNMFPEVDPLLGPEMRSTGEVLAMADSFGLAFFKAQEAAQQPLPTRGAVLITVADRDKERVLPAAREFADIGFTLRATQGTAEFLRSKGINCETAMKVHEGRPHIVDEITNESIDLLVNTPHGSKSEHDDSILRKAAIRHGVPYITTTAAARAAAQGIRTYLERGEEVISLQARHRSAGS